MSPAEPVARENDVATPVVVNVVVAEDEESYNDFVGRHPMAMIYHSLRFRDMLVALLGCRPVYGIARRGLDVVGVFPLMVATGAHGEVLNSLPYFGSNGGPLASAADGPTMAALLSWYREQACRVAAATIIENPLLGQLAVPATAQSERISVVTSLLEGEGREALLQRIDSSARRNVLKSERSNVVVATAGADPDSLKVLASLHRLSMQLNGGQVKTPEFFELLPGLFRPGIDFQLYLATVEEEAVGALLVLFHGRVAEYYIPATLPAARPLQPMAALLCFAMVDAAQRGCSLWNWGGSGVGNESLVRFKVKWAGRQSTYRYLTLINDEALLETAPADLVAAYPDFFVRPFSSAPRGADDGPA